MKAKILLLTLTFSLLFIGQTLAYNDTIIAVYNPITNNDNGLVHKKYENINSSSINIDNAIFPKIKTNKTISHNDKIVSILSKFVNLNQLLVVGVNNINDYDNITKAIDYANSQEAKIFLITLSVDDPFGLFARQFYYNLIDSCKKYPNMLFVISAGNERRKLTMFDENDKQDNLIVVGACDKIGNRAWYSNFGDYVDIYSLGEAYLSPVLEEGTSFSAPIIASYCSYIYDNCPNITGKEAKNKILEFANNKVILSKEIKQKMNVQ